MRQSLPGLLHVAISLTSFRTATHITQELSFHYIIFASPLFALTKVPRFCHEIQGSLPVTPGEISIGGFCKCGSRRRRSFHFTADKYLCTYFNA